VRTLAGILLLLGLGYGGLVGCLYAGQTWMLFPTALVGPGPASLPEGHERLSVRTPDGETLVGLRLPGPHEASPRLLGFGGNAWNADQLALMLARILPEAEVVTFHYRGYRPSSGRPSAAALLADSVLVHDALPADGRPLLAVGLSLGAGVAAHLASERPVEGLVLVTPFDSLAAVARDLYPFLPVQSLFKHEIDTAAAMRAHDRPVAVIAAGRDEVIPPRRTEALLPSIRRLAFHRVIQDASHNDLYGHHAFAPTLRDAVAAVLAALDETPN
jgi:uncharacterized protein